MNDQHKGRAAAADRGVRNSGMRLIATGLVVLIAIVLLIGLGTWQIERLHWKESLIADIAARQAAAPVPLAEVERLHRDGTDIEYRRVEVEGRYLNDRERHFLATWQGQSGFYVYTPMELVDGRYLFVNRGFVPYDKKSPQTRPQGEVAGQQSINGLARDRLDGKPSWIVPDNDVPGNIFYWKDLDAMTQSVGLDPGRVLPFFVDADSRENPGGLPIGGVTQVDLPNNHLQYALTWYGLAAALAVIVFVSWRRSRQPQRQ